MVVMAGLAAFVVFSFRESAWQGGGKEDGSL